jgi:hypothetical protein
MQMRVGAAVCTPEGSPIHHWNHDEKLDPLRQYAIKCLHQKNPHLGGYDPGCMISLEPSLASAGSSAGCANSTIVTVAPGQMVDEHGVTIVLWRIVMCCEDLWCGVL